jgi:hypothetical protein
VKFFSQETGIRSGFAGPNFLMIDLDYRHNFFISSSNKAFGGLLNFSDFDFLFKSGKILLGYFQNKVTRYSW